MISFSSTPSRGSAQQFRRPLRCRSQAFFARIFTYRLGAVIPLAEIRFLNRLISNCTTTPPRIPRKERQFGPGCPLTLPGDARSGYDYIVGNAGPKSGCANAWQITPINTSAKRLDTPKTMVGRSQRQVEGPIFSERCGVISATAVVVDFESIQRHAARKIMPGVFAAPSMAVHTERATS